MLSKLKSALTRLFRLQAERYCNGASKECPSKIEVMGFHCVKTGAEQCCKYKEPKNLSDWARVRQEIMNKAKNR